ncbi:glycosyltransferase [Metallosphaera tengchongensis]|uniref:Glycosyltransferase n=1 Tax=Metallosphaera tengchongensis TaxID=1532350 RepID=A0A6N0NU70_9CREN|nr:glycosyltransferase [Metallosphaera tengchongensis]QKQ99452.1 glycosyltransferase [Metallosphaera tengchongensis]
MLSIVIPAYNEEKRIGRTLQTLTSFFKNHQIIVVFDGNDRTPEIVSRFPVDLYVSSSRLGKGGALREGIKRSKGDIIILLDADLPVQVESLFNVIKKLEQADLVITTRVFNTLPVSRGLLHRAFILTTKLFFPSLGQIRDFQAGLKVMKRDKVAQVMDDLIMNDWIFDVNLVYSFLRMGFKVVEVEIPWSHMEEGSKVSRKIAKVSLMMLLSLIKLRTFYSPFRGVLRSRIYLQMEKTIIQLLR